MCVNRNQLHKIEVRTFKSEMRELQLVTIRLILYETPVCCVNLFQMLLDKIKTLMCLNQFRNKARPILSSVVNLRSEMRTAF
jgi:hypothetical protein